MSDASKDQEPLKQKKILYFSNLKEEENSCIVDLENSYQTSPRLRLRVFSTCFIFLFFLGILSSQILSFVNLSSLPTKQVETLIPYYYTLTAESSELLDYASSNNGGKILKSLSTASKSNPNSLTELISDSNSPDKCWNFEGSQGHIAIKLFQPISPQYFTLKHPNTLNYASAPRTFQVFSLSESVKIFHGAYELDLSILHEARHSQTTYKCLHNCSLPIEVILLEVTSNYGSPTTCVYQFKVHGVPI